MAWKFCPHCGEELEQAPTTVYVNVVAKDDLAATGLAVARALQEQLDPPSSEP
jgi:hypothetical protein